MKTPKPLSSSIWSLINEDYRGACAGYTVDDYVDDVFSNDPSLNVTLLLCTRDAGPLQSGGLALSGVITLAGRLVLSKAFLGSVVFFLLFFPLMLFIVGAKLGLFNESQEVHARAETNSRSVNWLM